MVYSVLKPVWKEIPITKEIVIAGAVRTAIGKFGGALANTPAPDLGAIVIREALNRSGLNPGHIDEVYMGCILQAAFFPRHQTLSLDQRVVQTRFAGLEKGLGRLGRRFRIGALELERHPAIAALRHADDREMHPLLRLAHDAQGHGV